MKATSPCPILPAGTSISNPDTAVTAFSSEEIKLPNSFSTLLLRLQNQSLQGELQSDLYVVAPNDPKAPALIRIFSIVFLLHDLRI